MSEILYRKWRPRAFAELAGQDHVARTLTNAIAGGRVAHAYLFTGPRGTGKTSTGRLFAKALNCTNRTAQGDACNQCELCRSFMQDSSWELIELDAASNRGIEDIRELRSNVATKRGVGEYKVYLIDEVHMLTEAAFNALLKTLEEPPPNVVFILATTDPQKVPPTIASRCQRFDFRRIPLAAAVQRLQTVCEGEGITCEPAALELIARAATGSLRDAENLLDQLATSYGRELDIEQVRLGLGLVGDERAPQLARLALSGELGAGLELIAAVRDDGLDLRQFQRELVAELRDLLLAKSGLPPQEGATVERQRELQAFVANLPTAKLLTALRAFAEADLKADPNSTLPLDLALADCLLAETSASPVAAAPRPAPEPVRAARPAASSPPSAPPPIAPEPVASAPTPPPIASEPSKPLQPPREVETLLAAQPPNGSGPAVKPSLVAARQQMRAIYDEVRAASVQLAALINSACDIIEVDEASLTFGFKYPVHAEKATAGANLELLTSVVSKVMGRPMSVRCLLDMNVASWQQRETASRSPLVRAAQEMGARVLPSQPEAEA